MSKIIDSLLNDEKIHSLIEKSANSYWLSNLYNHEDELTDDEVRQIIRFAYISTVASLNSEEDIKNVHYAYIALKSIDITRERESNFFSEIAGFDLCDDSIIYYFYLSSLALKMDQTINARLDLKNYTQIDNVSEDWMNRVLTGILQALILLIRKSNGYEDIRKALTIISSLQKEQKEFEEGFINQYQTNEQNEIAYSLVSLYHTSKALTETANYLVEGYGYKNRIENVVRQHLDIAIKLQNEDSRLCDFVKFIGKDLYCLISNSIWKGTGFQDSIRDLCKKIGDERDIIELLPSQRRAMEDKLFDVAANATVLQMPTSAGKTLMAEFNILITKSLRRDARIVYIVPSRALVNQIYYDLSSDLSVLGLTVEKTSSATEIDPTESDFLISDNIDVLVSTPEKLDLLIRRNHPSVDDVSLFIVDEAHTIENGDRGARLELLLAMLHRERSNSRFMLLSPFLPDNNNILADWLGGGHTIRIDWKPSEKLIIGLDVKKTTKKCEVSFDLLPSPFGTNVPEIKKTIDCGINIASNGAKEHILEYTVKQYAEKGKTQLILCYGKGTAGNTAKKIAQWADYSNPSEEVELVRKYMDEEIGEPTLFTNILSKGITVHHAGLSDESKLLIEHLIRNKQIQYVCATSTIAEGVNFPISSVYFDSYRKGDIQLSANDFWNIAGRAGRTMIDEYGKIILPFNSDKNKEKGLSLIQKSAEQITSVLAKLFDDADTIIKIMTQDPKGINFLLNNNEYKDSFGPLFQYFIHVLNVGQNEYYQDVVDIFKDSLEYNLLENQSQKEKFIDLCSLIYESIDKKYNNHSILKYADKTGFSVPSVLKIMYEKSEKSNDRDLMNWEPDAVFNRMDSNNLKKKIEIIGALKETGLGTDERISSFNPEYVAKMIIGWVRGDKYNALSTIHPHFRNEEELDKRLADFITYMNGMRFKSSWGLSALEGIVKGNEDEIKDSYIPSFVYYGVDNRKALAMRMIGIPRTLSSSLSQIIEGDMSNYTFSKIRSHIKTLNHRDWNDLKPRNSSLSGEEWKAIVDILVK